MVGPIIAQALKDSTGGQAGHLPVLLDLRVPASVNAPATIDLGPVPVGAVTTTPLTIVNDADIALWGPGGIDDLDYTLLPSPGVDAPAGAFSLDAGASQAHTLSLSGALPGTISEVVIVSSDDPDRPEVTVEITGEFVLSCSSADLAEPFGALDFSDIAAFLTAFDAGEPLADLAEPIGVLDFSDVAAFLASASCRACARRARGGDSGCCASTAPGAATSTSGSMR